MDGIETITEALGAAGLAAYCWTIGDDAISWSANAGAVLEAPVEALATGRGFAAHLDPATPVTRYDAVMDCAADGGAGVAFEIQYQFRPEGRGGPGGIWLEDRGRCFAGADGGPARVLGTVRRIATPSGQGGENGLAALPGRQRVMAALEATLAGSAANGAACALLLAGIGNLPAVNEAYGFGVGDEVVAEVANRLSRALRGGDSIARFSGTTFALILNRCGEHDVAAVAGRFLAALRESVVETKAGPVWALLSIGAAVLPRHARDAATAVSRAEEALAQAMRQPAGGFTLFTPSPSRLVETKANARCAMAIMRGLKEQRLRLAFQPVVDARSGETAFHEALLRLEEAESGAALDASRIIPVAEKLGLVRLVDQAMAEHVAEALAAHPEARISLNISGTTAADPHCHPAILSAIAARPGAGERLIVEITETVALGDLGHTARFAGQLKELGAAIAIDDFGAGYTSFKNLRDLPVDMLKIDGSFCRSLPLETDTPHFTRALIGMAQALGVKTVAEWVETAADATRLTEWGIDMMQGHLFGAADLPAPARGQALPPLAGTLAGFEAELAGEVTRLRAALSLLDGSFRARRRRAG